MQAKVQREHIIYFLYSNIYEDQLCAKYYGKGLGNIEMRKTQYLAPTLQKCSLYRN